MIRRDKDKILEEKIKTFPLIISVLLHIGVLVVFGAVNYTREDILAVKLISQDSGISLQIEPGSDKFRAESIQIRKIDTTSLFQEHEAASLTAETKKSITYGLEALSIEDNEQFSPSERNSNPSASSNTGGYTTTTLITGMHEEGKTIASVKEKGITNTGTPLSSFEKEVTEGELGSINGPSFLRMVKPEYPLLARRHGKKGKVVLRLLIDERGRLANVEIVERAGHGFDEAAVKAVKLSTFLPAKKNGKPITSRVLLPIQFKLTGED